MLKDVCEHFDLNLSHGEGKRGLGLAWHGGGSFGLVVRPRGGASRGPRRWHRSVGFVTGHGLGQEPKRPVETLILVDAVHRAAGDAAGASVGIAVEG